MSDMLSPGMKEPSLNGEDVNNLNQPEELTIDDNEYHVEEPKEGLTFASVDDIFSYYKKYGKQTGFPVMRRTSSKDESGEVRYVTFTCARAGKVRSSSKNLLNRRPSTKNECEARIRACLDRNGIWRISSVHLEHNHDVSPSKSRLFRCYRELSDSVKRRLLTNDVAGIRLNKNFNSFVVEAGGHENISFLEKDCRNFIQQVRRLQLAEGDAAAVQKYFLKMQAENADFFYSIDLDEEGRLKNVFWSDSRSRAAYKEFGEVVTFDTTYLTNKYDMPFAPFVGVNHHGQSILLGCGLISCEDTQTFTWLFENWLACMSDCAPKCIITDQDKAMKSAIEIVFPKTRHRWCLWHIMKKFHEKLGAYKNYDFISSSLQRIIYDSQISGEFEENWMRTVEKYDIKENAWLQGLYSERYRWVPCFVKDSFWAGMSTTQRSESVNAFFDGYVTSKTTLKQFVEQYDNAMASKVEKERLEDGRSASKLVPCVTMYKMEKQAQEAYTISKFQEFQQELIGKMYCELLSSKVEGIFSTYDIQEDIVIEEGTKRMIFKVCFNKEESEVKCSCQRFEFRGILCRHALSIMIRNDILQIPDKYILRRWRKDVTRCHTRVKISYNRQCGTEEHYWFDKMCNAFTEVADLAAGTVKSRTLVMTWIGDLKNEILKNGDTISKGAEVEVNQRILDPLATRRKGRPPSKRKESTISKGQKKKKNNKNSSTQESTSMNDQTLNSEVVFVKKPHDNNSKVNDGMLVEETTSLFSSSVFAPAQYLLSSNKNNRSLAPNTTCDASYPPNQASVHFPNMMFPTNKPYAPISLAPNYELSIEQSEGRNIVYADQMRNKIQMEENGATSSMNKLDTLLFSNLANQFHLV